MDRTLWSVGILAGQKRNYRSLSIRQGNGKLVVEEVWKEGTLTYVQGGCDLQVYGERSLLAGPSLKSHWYP